MIILLVLLVAVVALKGGSIALPFFSATSGSRAAAAGPTNDKSPAAGRAPTQKSPSENYGVDALNAIGKYTHVPVAQLGAAASKSPTALKLAMLPVGVTALAYDVITNPKGAGKKILSDVRGAGKGAVAAGKWAAHEAAPVGRLAGKVVGSDAFKLATLPIYAPTKLGLKIAGGAAHVTIAVTKKVGAALGRPVGALASGAKSAEHAVSSGVHKVLSFL